MPSKKQRRREKISTLVLELGALTVGSLAARFDVSTQTIRRVVVALCLTADNELFIFVEL